MSRPASSIRLPPATAFLEPAVEGLLQLALPNPLTIAELCTADRDMLKLTQQEFTGLPQQLHLELLVSMTLCLIGEALAGFHTSRQQQHLACIADLSTQ